MNSKFLFGFSFSFFFILLISYSILSIIFSFMWILNLYYISFLVWFEALKIIMHVSHIVILLIIYFSFGSELEAILTSSKILKLFLKDINSRQINLMRNFILFIQTFLLINFYLDVISFIIVSLYGYWITGILKIVIDIIYIIFFTGCLT